MKRFWIFASLAAFIPSAALADPVGACAIVMTLIRSVAMTAR